MVLDGARDDRIFPLVRDCGLDYLCLYSGNLPLELRKVAPYLLELPPQSGATRTLIQQGWGKSWGIFLRIGDPSNLRHHLRQFLRVEDEAGRRLIFRFYDPRVLRTFLPTCNAEELKAIFGRIESYVAESEGGRGILDFRFDGVRLKRTEIVLETADVGS
jgi:hypothetical protein